MTLDIQKLKEFAVRNDYAEWKPLVNAKVLLELIAAAEFANEASPLLEMLTSEYGVITLPAGHPDATLEDAIGAEAYRLLAILGEPDTE